MDEEKKENKEVEVHLMKKNILYFDDKLRENEETITSLPGNKACSLLSHLSEDRQSIDIINACIFLSLFIIV